VQTHLDLDHVGGLADFPWATVHVHAAELEDAIERPTMRARMRYRSVLWKHEPSWRPFAPAGESWHGFETVRALEGLPEQLVAVPLPGHTRGHCGVAIESEDGWQLAAGDAYFDPREVHAPRPRCTASLRLFQLLVTADRDQRDHNQQRLRELVASRPDVQVFNAHAPFA
jgi:glyoxylase-like metal-dependent hydrolase (beta-lactamase superfamily II)